MKCARILLLIALASLFAAFVAGHASAEPVAAVSPAGHDFGTVEVDTSQVFTKTFTIENTGGEDLVIDQLSVASLDIDTFLILNDTCSNTTLIPGGSATVDVQFDPRSTGAKVAVLTIPSNVPGVEVQLNGTGIFTGYAIITEYYGYIYTAYSLLDGTFGPLTYQYDIGDYSYAIAMADFDNDGDNDVVAGVGNNSPTGHCYYLANNGDGTFAAPVYISPVRGMNSWAMDMAAGDFNNDGLMDFIMDTNSPDGTSALFLGNGDGTFRGPNAMAMPYGYAYGIDAADFNHDGNLDIARGTGPDGYVLMHLGDGNGHFAQGQFIGDAGDWLYGLVAGDFDNDGHADVIACSGSGIVYGASGNGDGTFMPMIRLPSLDYNQYQAFAAYDYDQDGDLDIVATHYHNANEAIYFAGNGDFTFAAGVQVGTFPERCIAVAGPPNAQRFGAPVAVADPVSIAIDLDATVDFDGSASADSNGTIVSWEWTFGDGDADSGETVSHTYITEGLRKGMLKVVDNDGNAAYAAFTVLVRGTYPTAEANGPCTFGEAVLSNGAWTASLDGTGSSDAESGFTYSWDFGDSFSDDFEDADMSGWSVVAGNWSEHDGVLQQTDTNGYYQPIIFTAGNKLDDVIIEADATFTSGYQHAYLLFRVKDAANFYAFCLRGNNGSDDIFLQRNIAGNTTNVVQRYLPFSIINNKTYHMKVVCVGSRIQGYLDGVLVIEADDTFFTSGLVGLATWGSNATFDDLVVTSAPVSGKNPVHVYRKGPGTYTATLTVTDAAGQTATDTATVNLVYNDPPTADAGGPYSSTELEAYAGRWAVQLDGSASTDDVEIVRYDWLLEQSDFAGTEIDGRWIAYNASQNDEVTINSGGWGGGYLFNSHRVSRDQAGTVAAEARIKVVSREVMFGFKNTSGNYSYTAMPYALYFYTGDNKIQIYEDGTHKGWTGHTFTPGHWYDMRVELKNPAGARYYFRPSGSTQWILAYDSNYASAHTFLPGLTVTGTHVIDDYKLILTGKSPVACYYEPGAHTIELTVADRAGQTSTDTAQVTITQGQPPVAEAGDDVFLGEEDIYDGAWYVIFDGSASTDDFGIYDCQWDFGDGQTGSGCVVAHSYASIGSYTATLTVRDHAFQASADTLTVAITPGDPPVANAGPDVNLNEANASRGSWLVKFNGYRSTDDFGIVRYSWEFGDGTPAVEGKIANHAFALPGVYTVTLTVYDAVNQSASDTCTVTIAAGDPPVADAGGPYTALESEVAAGKAFLLFDAGKSTDDGDGASHGILRYVWDFGTETFDGVYFDKRLWDYSYQVYQGIKEYGDYVSIWGEGWGNNYLFTAHAVDKRPGLVCQASLQQWGNTMIGFKHADNQNYSYTNMPYALYLNSGGLHIYEDGAYRLYTGYGYTQGAWYDYRVVINDDGGADYFYKEHAAEAWTLIYHSTYVSGGALKAGLTVNDNLTNIDNFHLTASGKSVIFPVRKPGQVTLTVEDNAHQTSTQTVAVNVIGSSDPVANAGGPYFGTFELPVTLNGTYSTDDNAVVKYLWDFGDGTTKGSGPTPTHTYAVGSAAGPETKTVTLTVYDAGGHSSSSATTTVTLAAGPVVACVPWQFSGPMEVPHHTWDGNTVRLKGAVKGGIGTLTYTWDFADGSGVQTGTVTNKYVIEASHAYTGSVGVMFNARLTVVDSLGNSHSDTYPVEILPYSQDTRVDFAIDEGLWWLHKTQYRDGAYANSYWNGRWESYGSYYGSVTGSALQSFMINGHRETGDPARDPYVETVRNGLELLFKHLGEVSVPRQTYGDPDFPYDGTGNHIGLAARWSDRMPYEGGMIMDGIVATHTPNRVAWSGNVNVVGRTYQSILQDMVDAYAFGQYDDWNYGGWRYGWNQWPDNSACQWAAIGMIPSAQAPWNCVIPQWVRQSNDRWLAYSYHPGNRWFGYTDPNGVNESGHATRPSGMVQMVMSVDNYKSDSRWVGAESWFAEPGNWNWFISNVGYQYYGWYAFVKAMRLSRTETLSNGFNWFTGANGVADRLIANQAGDGGWPDYWGRAYTTSWSVIMLTPSLFVLPPVAEAGPDVLWAFDMPLTFDGSNSYHLDPGKMLVKYEWDFDGDGSYDYPGDNPIASHTYEFDPELEYPVAYTAVLRVTDNTGDTDTDTRQVTISDIPHPPFARITVAKLIEGQGIATAGLVCTLDGRMSFDIDLNDYIALHEWDFDGSNGFDFDNPESTEPNPSVVFAAPGLYTIGLRVWDTGLANPNGNEPLPSLPAYLTVRVEADVAPLADAGGPYTIDEGSPLTLAGSGSDANLAGDPLMFTWDLDNDGVFDDAFGETPTHTFMQNGVFTITLKVSDSLLEATSSATVTVNDLGPTAAFSWLPEVPAEGAAVQFTSAATSSPDTIALYEWDFAGLASGNGQNPSFTFPDDGVYPVTLTVTDSDGSIDSVTHDVTVTAVGPAARNDIATVPPNNAPNAINVLANDTWLPGPAEVLTIISVTDGAHGTVAITGGTGLTFKPASRYQGTDQFTYTIEDEDSLTSTATVNVTVKLAGDANRDCSVNVLDLIFVRNRLNQPVGTGDNWKADVNGDGKINVLDLIYSRNRLNAKCL